MRWILALALLASPQALRAQVLGLSSRDSALVGRLLLAEDRRDSADAAIGQAARHRDPRIRLLAQRALGRIRDPKFVARDSLSPLPAPVVWPEPAWRLRYRALSGKKDDCAFLRMTFTDSAWHVRLRAMDVMTETCDRDQSLVATLRTWIDALPRTTSHRTRGDVSWHAGAHALVALARVRPEEAQTRVVRLGAHPQWQVRMYAARAAGVLFDSTTLRTLVRDPNDNVKEAAIDALAKLTRHTDDELYLAALRANGPQAVRAAAMALKGSPRDDVRAAANAAFVRWVARRNASERDARVALLEAAGRPPSDDRPPPLRAELPREAVALALGKDVRLRVAMSPASGGGSFVVRLRGDVAPMMAARVLKLARAHYYDGGNWHRVEPDFVIQGGGPGTNEYVGYPSFFRDELGTLPHARGTVGMSTRGHDSGDAQWFVNLKDNLRLGPDYSVFAEVVDGMPVVDGILEGDIVSSVRVLPR